MHRSRPVLSRVLAIAMLVLALGVGALAAADTAVAATPSPTPIAASTLVYSVTVSGYATNAAGTRTDQTPRTDTFHVDCSSKPCLLEEYNQLPVKVPGTTHTVVPGHGTSCGRDYVGTETIEITIDLAGFRSTLDQPGSGVEQCGGESTSETFAEHEDLTGTLISGSTCYLGGPCPSATPKASALTSTGPQTFASPGVLSTLPTLVDAARPANIVWAVALTIVLVILVALPTSLLNSAVERGTERLAAWRKRMRPVPSRTAVEPEKTSPDDKPVSPRPVALAGWPLAAIGVLAATLISSFVDPSFGFNGASVRTFFSILVSFLLDAVAGWFVLIWLVRRAIPGATARFHFAPATLLIVLAAVVFTRLTGFQPGIVFGLVAGVTFGAVVATADKARNALIGLGYSFVVAILGWVGYCLLSGIAHPDGGVVFVQETFSALAIGGIAALPIALIPLRGLTGHAVFTWSRWVWAGAYAIGLFGFFFVLMPFPFAWKGVPLSIGVWLGLYLLYAVLALVGWLVLARPWKKDVVDPEESAAASPESAP